MPVFVRANRLLLPAFALFVALAFFNRTRPERHKRLLVAGTVFVLEPILSRAAFGPFEAELVQLMGEAGADIYWWYFETFATHGLLFSLVAYDWSLNRRVHPITLWSRRPGLTYYYMAASHNE